MKSVYDVLHSPPRLNRALAREQEALAQAIVASGRMRIDSDNDANFLRRQVEQSNIAVSLRELHDKKLVPRTHAMLTSIFARRHNAQNAPVMAAQTIEQMRAEIKKRGSISAEVEIQLARALVLCNAAPVITLIYLERAEIFISFGHAVGDVMDVAMWRDYGQNSGLQSMGPGENSVYVSCGGNPFLEEDERRHSGDGKAALARFMIIAAQETGHNADMIRDLSGRQVGRYTLMGWQMAPSQAAGEGRRADQQRTNAYYNQCINLGLRRIAEWERQLKFYRDMKAVHFRRRAAWFKSRFGWMYLKRKLKQGEMARLLTIQKSPYPAMQLRTFFEDMLVNLEPKADVYKRANPREEEAIACVEALARVPQQEVKWGRDAVTCCTPRLSTLYHSVVVPGCARAVARLGGA